MAQGLLFSSRADDKARYLYTEILRHKTYGKRPITVENVSDTEHSECG